MIWRAHVQSYWYIAHSRGSAAQGSSGMASLTDSAVAALLSCCKHLKLEPVLTFQALSLLADRYLPKLGTQPLDTAGGPQGPAEWQLLLAAVACVLAVLHQQELGNGRADGSRQDKALAQVYKAAGSAIGTEFQAQFSSDDLLQMEVLVLRAGGQPEAGGRRATTVDYLHRFWQQIQQADLKAFRGIDIDVCHTLLELMYARIGGAAESRGTIERGGSLMAAALVTAAFCLAAPPTEIQASLPFLSGLAELSGFPKEVINSRAQAILQHALK